METQVPDRYRGVAASTGKKTQEMPRELPGFPKRTRLRDGTEVDVRLVNACDGPAILQFFAGQPEEDRMYLRDDVTKEGWIEKYLQKLTTGSAFAVVAESDGKIVGHATLYRRQFGWSAHVGEIRISVAHALQGRGLARKLMRPLISAGLTIGLEQVIAHIVDNQLTARRLLERLGFQKDAVLTGRVKDVHGTRRDLVVMCNEISNIWGAMEDLMLDYSPSQE